MHLDFQQGPRLKMMNALARSTGVVGAAAAAAAGSFTSAASVGGGSNAGSASIPSPELRSSPQQHHRNPNLASSLSPSDWSFPVSGGGGGLGAEGGLGVSAAAGTSAADGAGSSSSGSTPRLGAEAPAGRAVVTSGDVEVDVSGINLAGDDELGSSGIAAGGEASCEGGVAAAAAAVSAVEGGGVSPPADVWVASALTNAEDVVDGGD